MTREVDLVSYLPPFLAEFKEISAALEAENPEFVLVWKAAERVLKNEFIATADEYGIGRFEKILQIFPSSDDTLESRRLRVQSRWFTTIPYTWRVLIQKMSMICGEVNFKMYFPQKECYGIEIQVYIEPQSEFLLQEIDRMLVNYLPVNLCYQITGNVIRIKQERIMAGSARSVYVKVKAGPGSTHLLSSRHIILNIGTGTVEHIKAVYLPEGK